MRPWHWDEARNLLVPRRPAVRRSSAFPYQRKRRDVRRYMTFRVWMAENLDKNLSVDVLAKARCYELTELQSCLQKGNRHYTR